MDVSSSTQSPFVAPPSQSSPPSPTQEAVQAQQQADVETARSAPAADQRVGTVVDTQA